jgi:hypothetical protein
MSVTPRTIKPIFFSVLLLQPATVSICFAQNNNQMPALKDENKIDPIVMRKRNADRVPGFTQSPDPPSGFPAPIYTSGQFAANFTTNTKPGTSMFAGTIMTKDTAMAPYGWYKQNLSGNGWTLNKMPPTKAEKEGKAYTLSATKGDTTATVTTVKAKKGDFTIVNVTCFTQPKPAASPRKK